MFVSFFFRFVFCTLFVPLAYLICPIFCFFLLSVPFKLPQRRISYTNWWREWRKKIAEFAINAFVAVIRFAFINCDGGYLVCCCCANSIFWNAHRTLHSALHTHIHTSTRRRNVWKHHVYKELTSILCIHLSAITALLCCVCVRYYFQANIKKNCLRFCFSVGQRVKLRIYANSFCQIVFFVVFF